MKNNLERSSPGALREPDYNISRAVAVHLGIQYRDCGCPPIFENCTTGSNDGGQMTWEIIEAAEIVRMGSMCVSRPSVSLRAKENDFLTPSSGINFAASFSVLLRLGTQPIDHVTKPARY